MEWQGGNITVCKHAFTTHMALSRGYRIISITTMDINNNDGFIECILTVANESLNIWVIYLFLHYIKKFTQKKHIFL